MQEPAPTDLLAQVYRLCAAPHPVREWARGFESDETVGLSRLHTQCPLAHFLRGHGVPVVRVFTGGFDLGNRVIYEPERWLATAIREIDAPYRYRVTAKDLLEIIDWAEAHPWGHESEEMNYVGTEDS